MQDYKKGQEIRTGLHTAKTVLVLKERQETGLDNWPLTDRSVALPDNNTGTSHCNDTKHLSFASDPELHLKVLLVCIWS